MADGVSCPGGGTAPSTETYAFDDETITGTHTSLHGAVCGIAAGDEASNRSRCSWPGLRPARSSVIRCRCNDIAMCY